MPLLRFRRCLAAFRFLPFGSFLSKRQKTKAAKIICRLRSPHTCMASRGAEASKLGPPLYIAMQTHQQQPQLKPQLKPQTATPTPPLATLADCLRSPCSEGANSSPRYARRTICPFFAFSGVWQLFVFCLLVRSSLKGRKPKQPRLFVAYGLHIPAWRAEGQRPRNSARPSTSPCRTVKCSFDNRFYIIVSADNNDYRLFLPCYLPAHRSLSPCRAGTQASYLGLHPCPP